MIKRLLLTSVLCCVSGFAFAAHAMKMPMMQQTAEIASDVVTIKTPQVEMEATGATSTEVIMDLDNTGKYAHELVAATSPVAKQVQLHKTIDHGTEMVQVKDILIAPHHERDLKVGGFHVMLMGLNKQLNRGDIVPITLIFKDGSWLKINVAVV